MFYECSPNNLDEFVDQLLDGQLTPYLKSEPVPTSNDAPVKVCLYLKPCSLFPLIVIELISTVISREYSFPQNAEF